MSRIIKKLTVSALLLVFLSFTLVSSVNALVLTPGVTPGAQFIWNITASWSSSDEYASVPPELVDINQTESFEVRISEVADSNVTIFWAMYFKNGSDPIADRGFIDVDTGEYYDVFAAIIAGNLNAGERIHPLGEDTITINETVIRAYESGNRETNHIMIESTNATTGVHGRMDWYFDKQAGILVESEETNISSDASTSTTIRWKLKETNANGWVVPEFPSVLVLPVLMGITVLAAVAYKKRHTRITTPVLSC
jgi:hypothetical protein